MIANIMAMSPKVLQAVQPARLSLIGVRHLSIYDSYHVEGSRCAGCMYPGNCPTYNKANKIGYQIRDRETSKKDVHASFKREVIGTGTLLGSALTVVLLNISHPFTLPVLMGTVVGGYYVMRKGALTDTNDLLLKARKLKSLINATEGGLLFRYRDERANTLQMCECISLQEETANAQVRLKKSSK